MNENLIVDLWNLIKDSTDQKKLSGVAENFVDLLADYGISDSVLDACLGSDDYLDEAISYYLEKEGDSEGGFEEDEEDYEDYDEEEDY